VIRLRADAAAIVAAAASVAVLLAAEVPVGVAAWAVLLVAWASLAGIRAARWCGFADARPLDRVAVGYALGLFATLAIDQLFVTGLGVAWRWTAPVVLAPLALGEAVVLARSAMGARVSPAVGLVVAGGALLAVGHEWIWSLPLGGAALAAAWLCTERGRGARLSLQLGLLATSVVGAVVALVRRDGRWWLTQNDTHFYEALAAGRRRDSVAGGAVSPVTAPVSAPVGLAEPPVRPPVTFDLARPSRPEGVVDSLRAVPDVSGLPTRAAVRALHAAGFRVVLVGVGAGASTIPAAGTLLPAGALIRLPSAR